MVWAGILIPVLILLLVLWAFKDTLFSQEAKESKLASVAFEPKDTANFTGEAQNTEPTVVFTNTTAVIGEPLEVTVENVQGDLSDWTFTWKVGDETITDNTTNTYTPTEEDNENFITVVAKSPEGQHYRAGIYLSKLPVVYLTLDGEIGETYSSAVMSMQGNSEYTAENSDLYSGDITVKLRGNSTKYLPKQPYKIKLDSKANILGMGSNKHWVLLANAIDHTLIRNKLVYDFSADLGSSYAAESDNVVLIINDEYKGVYQLCEHIRVGSERVDIFDWEELAEDAAQAIAVEESQNDAYAAMLENALVADFSWLSEPYEFTYGTKTYTMTDYVTIPDVTGGFIAEMDFYHMDTDDYNNSLKTNFMQPLYFSIPETAGTNNELADYAYTYLQTFEYALHSYDFTYHEDDTHYAARQGRYNWESGWDYSTYEVDFSAPDYDNYHYSALFDLDSLVNNFLVCELTVNWDSMKNSMLITKDIDGLAELNPVWDFDWAFGNNNMYQIYTYYTDIWQTTDEYFTNEQCYQAMQWNRFLIKDPYFLLQVYEKYQEIRPTLLEDMIKDGGTLDTYYEELLEAGLANDDAWQWTYREYRGENYEEACESLKTFITDRIAWLDEQFASYETLVKSLGYYSPSSELSVASVTYNEQGQAVIQAATTNTSAFMMVFEVNGTTFEYANVVNGQAEVTIDAELLQDAGENIVQIRIKDTDGNYITNTAVGDNADEVYALSNYSIF